MTERLALTRTGVRTAAVALVVVLLAAVHIRRPATFCLLRATTGVPCPFCGGTTAAVDLGRGRMSAAVAASPLAVAMLFGWPVVEVVRRPGWWRQGRVRVALVLGVLAVAEVWQLHRFGLIRG